MTTREGFRRIRTTGKVILGIGLALDVMLLVGLALVAIAGQRVQIFATGFLGIPLTVVGALILIAVWIAEGFAAKGQAPHS